MAYTPRTWRDDASGQTPMEAAHLNNLEIGLQVAAAKADQNASNLTSLQASAGIHNHTSILTNTANVSGAANTWVSNIPFTIPANPGSQVIKSGSKELFRLDTPGLYLWTVRGTLVASPTGEVLVDAYQYTSSAGDNVTIQFRTYTYGTNHFAGSAVLELGGLAKWHNFGIRVNSGFIISPGRLITTFTRLA